MLPRPLRQVLNRSRPPCAPLRRFSTSPPLLNVIRELEQRGMLSELTSRAARTHVNKPTTVYLGVDPSARSLHVGNLLALIGLLHFRLQGHNAVALIGGATGAIGDPSGRSTERNALSPETLQANVEGITQQLTAFLERGVKFAQERTRRRDGKDEEGEERVVEGSVRIVNNLDWLGGVSLLEFLSTAGKMARVSTMLSRESVKSRLDSSSGLSFTEFSYQLLQAYDFLRLHRDLGCTIQLGGSDQLGNIVSGIDMIRRDNYLRSAAAAGEGEVEGKEGEKKKDEEDPAFGLTFSLLTTASGEKFGKSAGNAIWLDPGMTSPFDVYQFFLRTTDEEVERYLKIFTFIRVVELDGIMHDHKANPKNRIAQQVLAAEATELIHGAEGLRQALAATSVFYSSDLSSQTDLSSLIDALDAAPSSLSSSTTTIPSLITRLPRADHLDQSLESLVISSGLLPSKTQARKAIEAGTIQLNGKKVPPKSHQRKVGKDDLLEGKLVVLKAGKAGHKAVVLE